MFYGLSIVAMHGLSTNIPKKVLIQCEHGKNAITVTTYSSLFYNLD
mgnify:CR=1 FL=1